MIKRPIRISLLNLMRMNNLGAPIRIDDSNIVDEYLPHSLSHLHHPPLQHHLCMGIQVRNGDAVTDFRMKSKNGLKLKVWLRRHKLKIRQFFSAKG